MMTNSWVWPSGRTHLFERQIMKVKILRPGFIKGVQVFPEDVLEIDSKQFSERWMEMLTGDEFETPIKRQGGKAKKSYRDPVSLSKMDPKQVLTSEVI